MPRYRLTLAYDGTGFAGSQVQPRERTVQGELQQVLQAIAGEPVATVFAGRTDRGVHAAGQVVAINLADWRGTVDALERAIQSRLPSDLSVVVVEECDDSFNPRFDAKWREYRYWIAPGAPNPFLGRYAWIRRAPLDAAAVAAGARCLLGTHDFASFAGGGEGVPWSERARRRRGTTRTISCCECHEVVLEASPGVVDQRSVLILRVVADGFLPRMVRNIVGALTEVGQGREEPVWIGQILAAADRRAGSIVAPPHGLTLWRVGFGDEPVENW
jgi:tRNA pseudouridine38-40 synthase